MATAFSVTECRGYFGRGRFSCSPNSATLTSMKVKEVLRLLCNDGWRRVASRDGHRQFKHPTKPGRVTVSGEINHDLPPAALNSILQPLGDMAASHS